MMLRLKELRLQAKMSQQRLADLIGVSQQSINKYENHNVEPDFQTLCALADVFHTSVDDLIGRKAMQECDLSAAEAAALQEFRLLSDAEQASIVQIMKQLNAYQH